MVAFVGGPAGFAETLGPLPAGVLAAGLVDNKVCAIDATWSGLRFVIRVGDRPRPSPR